jgi:hypothetical protein
MFRIAHYILLLSLSFACISGIYRFKQLDTPSRVLSVLTCIAMVTEMAAFWFLKKFHNNLPVYIVYSFIEYFLLCLYFNNIIGSFKRKSLGIYFGVAGTLFGMLDLLFVGHFHTINSNFLFLEGLMIIGMSLQALAGWLADEDFLYVHKYPHFWFICSLVFFWTFTYLGWGLNYNSNKKREEIGMIISCSLLVVNIFFYLGIGTIFLLYAKMQIRNE